MHVLSSHYALIQSHVQYGHYQQILSLRLDLARNTMSTPRAEFFHELFPDSDEDHSNHTKNNKAGRSSS